MKERIIYEVKDTQRLLRALPSGAVAMFCMSVVLMNLLANKEVSTGIEWFALDCGFVLSWVSFLSMDVVTKRFGPKAAIKLSLFAVTVNLGVCVILKAVSAVPGNWGAFYELGTEHANTALDSTRGGTWYVLFGSTVALIASSIVNSTMNHTIGKHLRANNFTSFAIRSYVSTLFGQFVDNLVFSLIVSYHFFGWSLTQCVTCSILGCLVELLCEVIFSPLGFKISQKWEDDNVGAEYLGGSKCE